mgnify:CR=1 FL=1
MITRNGGHLNEARIGDTQKVQAPIYAVGKTTPSFMFPGTMRPLMLGAVLTMFDAAKADFSGMTGDQSLFIGVAVLAVAWLASGFVSVETGNTLRCRPYLANYLVGEIRTEIRLKQGVLEAVPVLLLNQSGAGKETLESLSNTPGHG